MLRLYVIFLGHAVKIMLVALGDFSVEEERHKCVCVRVCQKFFPYVFPAEYSEARSVYTANFRGINMYGADLIFCIFSFILKVEKS